MPWRPAPTPTAYRSPASRSWTCLARSCCSAAGSTCSWMAKPRTLRFESVERAERPQALAWALAALHPARRAAPAVRRVVSAARAVGPARRALAPAGREAERARQEAEPVEREAARRGRAAEPLGRAPQVVGRAAAVAP